METLLEVTIATRNYFADMVAKGIILPQSRPNKFSDAEPLALLSRLNAAIAREELR